MKSIQKFLYTAILLGGTLTAQQAQAQSWKDLLNTLKNGSTNKTTTNSGSNNSSTSGSSLSSSTIASGLKEALNIGANNASTKLSTKNGFFGNAAVKILMPAEFKKVETTLRQVGMGSVVDNAILAMNRAAEDAAGKAAPIFVNAITTMSITDALGILNGGNTAATNYLKTKTTNQLVSSFKPVIDNSLAKTNATTLWTKVFSTYNKLPIVKQKVNADLSSYVTERAVSGMFTSIAEEEAKIRTNPAGTASNLIQQVFGRK